MASFSVSVANAAHPNLAKFIHILHKQDQIIRLKLMHINMGSWERKTKNMSNSLAFYKILTVKAKLNF